MNIEEKIKEIIADEMSIEEEDVTPNAYLEIDLGCDSLDRIEIVMRIEEEFDIEITDEQAESIQTVAQVIEAVKRLSAGVNQ